MNYKFCAFLFTFQLLFIVLALLASASVVINEIMYDPNQCNDAYCEWIELFNPTNNSINLTNWKISDRKSDNLSQEHNRTIVFSSETIIEAQNYFIIAKNKENFSYWWNVSCPIAQSNFVLNNDQEIVRLYDSNGFLIDEVYYNSSLGANNNGNSIQKISTSSWCSSIPTPGAPNNCSEQQNASTSITFFYPSDVYNNKTNFTIAINALNFAQGSYDLKIDIKSGTKYLNRVWTSDGWSSKNEWLEGFITINSSNHSFSTINIIDSEDYFVGNATAQIKLRNSTHTFLSSPFNISILNGTFQGLSTQAESEITITAAPDKAKFGESIDIELNIYKGDTAKYAVYVYVENDKGIDVSDKVTLHVRTKFSNQTIKTELQLKCKNESGSYEIVAEGLGTEDRKKLKLNACTDNNESMDEKALTIGGFSYSLTVPNSIALGEQFKVKIRIASKSDEEKNFLIWSYVYRGNKCYSCGNGTRESNAKSLIVEPGSTVEVELWNIVESAEPGNYKLKIKALQEGLKTPKEFTYDIKIESVNSSSQKTPKSGESTVDDNKVTLSNTIIESKAFSFREALPYVFASICALLAIYIIIKKI